jgi:hypothetical protein
VLRVLFRESDSLESIKAGKSFDGSPTSFSARLRAKASLCWLFESYSLYDTRTKILRQGFLLRSWQFLKQSRPARALTSLLRHFPPNVELRHRFVWPSDSRTFRYMSATRGLRCCVAHVSFHLTTYLRRYLPFRPMCFHYLCFSL